jgi:hypothetical protein
MFNIFHIQLQAKLVDWVAQVHTLGSNPSALIHIVWGISYTFFIFFE